MMLITLMACLSEVSTVIGVLVSRDKRQVSLGCHRYDNLLAISYISTATVLKFV